MTTQIQKDTIAGNEKYVSTFTDGDLALPPSKQYLVVTCMDARIDPTSAFGIPLGAAHVIRNAGASAHDALRSIIISQQLLGTQEILLVKHTGCGMLTFKNEDAYQVVEKGLGKEQGEKLKGEGYDFLAFGNLEAEVQKDVEWLKQEDLVKKGIEISGWVYEVESGKVKKIV